MRYPIAVLLVLLGHAGCSPANTDSKIDWLSSIPLGIEQTEPGQAVFVYFQASWCRVCERVDREMSRTSRVTEALEGFVPVKIDVDAQPRTAAAYRAQALPTFLILDRHGAIRARSIGFLSEDELVNFLRASGVR